MPFRDSVVYGGATVTVDRRGGCEGKVRYASVAEAHWTLGKHKKTRRNVSGVYRCQCCGGFHIGRPDWSKKTRRK